MTYPSLRQHDWVTNAEADRDKNRFHRRQAVQDQCRAADIPDQDVENAGWPRQERDQTASIEGPPAEEDVRSSERQFGAAVMEYGASRHDAGQSQERDDHRGCHEDHQQRAEEAIWQDRYRQD